jgi:DNA-binding MarR family transcriptional regulator
VVRKEDQNDRRSIQIFLTPKGRDIASQVGAIAMEYNQLIQDNILPEDMDAFDRSLTRLENNL